MWRKRKLIPVAILGIMILAGALGGIALAQNDTGNQTPSESGNQTPCQARYEALLDKVAQIYESKTGVALDKQALKDSVVEAGKESQLEALKNRLDALVQQGVIDQGQADDYLQWWQSRPDMPLGLGNMGPGLRTHGGHMGPAFGRGFGGGCW